jgi:hypothetical protein
MIQSCRGNFMKKIILFLVFIALSPLASATGVRIQACGTVTAKDSSYTNFDNLPGTGFLMRVDCNGDRRVDSFERATLNFMSLATPGVEDTNRSSAARKGHINRLTKGLIKAGKRNSAPYLCMHLYASANPCDSLNHTAAANGVYKMCSKGQFRTLADDVVIPKVSLKPRVLRTAEISDICTYEKGIKTDN